MVLEQRAAEEDDTPIVDPAGSPADSEEEEKEDTLTPASPTKQRYALRQVPLPTQSEPYLRTPSSSDPADSSVVSWTLTPRRGRASKERPRTSRSQARLPGSPSHANKGLASAFPRLRQRAQSSSDALVRSASFDCACSSPSHSMTGPPKQRWPVRHAAGCHSAQPFSNARLRAMEASAFAEAKAIAARSATVALRGETSTEADARTSRSTCSPPPIPPAPPSSRPVSAKPATRGASPSEPSAYLQPAYSQLPSWKSSAASIPQPGKEAVRSAMMSEHDVDSQPRPSSTGIVPAARREPPFPTPSHVTINLMPHMPPPTPDRTRPSEMDAWSTMPPVEEVTSLSRNVGRDGEGGVAQAGLDADPTTAQWMASAVLAAKEGHAPHSASESALYAGARLPQSLWSITSPAPLHHSSLPLGFDGLHVGAARPPRVPARSVGPSASTTSFAAMNPARRPSSSEPRTASKRAPAASVDLLPSGRAADRKLMIPSENQAKAPASVGAPGEAMQEALVPSFMTEPTRLEPRSLAAQLESERPRTAPEPSLSAAAIAGSLRPAGSEHDGRRVRGRAGSALGRDARQRGLARASHALWALPDPPKFLLGSHYLQYSAEMPFGAPPRRQQEAMRTHLYLRDLPKPQRLVAERIIAGRGHAEPW